MFSHFMFSSLFSNVQINRIEINFTHWSHISLLFFFVSLLIQICLFQKWKTWKKFKLSKWFLLNYRQSLYLQCEMSMFWHKISASWPQSNAFNVQLIKCILAFFVILIAPNYIFVHSVVCVESMSSVMKFNGRANE